MWTRAVLLFALCLGFYARGETFCKDGSHKACQSRFSNPPSFPKTEEDLLALCPETLSYLDCVQNFVAECDIKVMHDSESLSKFQSYLTDVCKEDSTIREGIVKELPCIKDTWGKFNYTNTCLQSVREAMIYLEENESDNGDSPDNSKYECFYMTARMACIMAPYDIHCGKRAKDVLLDLYIRTGYLDGSCKEDEMEEVLKVVSILELEFELKERIGSVLHTYREFLSLDEVPEPETRNKRHTRRSLRRIMNRINNKNVFQ